MIIQTENGWQVVSKTGKPLSKDNLTEEEAKKRLREIHAFKYMRAHQVGPKKVVRKVPSKIPSKVPTKVAKH